MGGEVVVVRFTENPRRVTAAGPSSLVETAELINLRGLELTLTLVGFEGPSDPVLLIGMETGMRYAQDFAPWGRFLPLVAPGDACTRHFDQALRFVRWNVVELAGATAAWFTLEGKALP